MNDNLERRFTRQSEENQSGIRPTFESPRRLWRGENGCWEIAGGIAGSAPFWGASANDQTSADAIAENRRFRNKGKLVNLSNGRLWNH